MRKLILILSVCSLIACESEEEIQQRIDQYAIQDSLQQIINDSIVSRILEHQKIAFGKIEFGISKAEYKKLQKDFTANIGKYKYMLNPYFNDEGKLYMLKIQTSSETATYLDNKLKDKLTNISEVISTKYGSPKKSNKYPSMSDLKPGYINWVYIWRIGNKMIKAGIGEKSSSYKYYVNVDIYDLIMYGEVKNQQRKVEESKKLEDSEQF